MSIIAPGADAPAFSLESHEGDTIKSDDLFGKKNVLLVFYPLDFTPT